MSTEVSTSRDIKDGKDNSIHAYIRL